MHICIGLELLNTLGLDALHEPGRCMNRCVEDYARRVIHHDPTFHDHPGFLAVSHADSADPLFKGSSVKFVTETEWRGIEQGTVCIILKKFRLDILLSC